MAVANDLLLHHELGLEEVAQRVGYSSASAFSSVFSREVGIVPSRYTHAP